MNHLTDALIVLFVGGGFVAFLFYVARNLPRTVLVVFGNKNPKDNYTVYERKDGSRFLVREHTGEVEFVRGPTKSKEQP